MGSAFNKFCMQCCCCCCITADNDDEDEEKQPLVPQDPLEYFNREVQKRRDEETNLWSTPGDPSHSEREDDRALYTLLQARNKTRMGSTVPSRTHTHTHTHMHTRPEKDTLTPDSHAVCFSGLPPTERGHRGHERHTPRGQRQVEDRPGEPRFHGRSRNAAERVGRRLPRPHAQRRGVPFAAADPPHRDLHLQQQRAPTGKIPVHPGSPPVPGHRRGLRGQGSPLLPAQGRRRFRRGHARAGRQPAAAAGPNGGHERARRGDGPERDGGRQRQRQVLEQASPSCSDNRHKAGGSSHQAWTPGPPPHRFFLTCCCCFVDTFFFFFFPRLHSFCLILFFFHF